MSFSELLKDITTLLSEANKWDKNKQQQYFLKELRSINRKLLKQGKTQKRNLILGIIFSSIASGFFGYFLTDDGRETFLIFIGYVPEDGVYDTTYKSYSGGFYIIQPGTSWAVASIETNIEYVSDFKGWEHAYFLDGGVLENSKTNVIMHAWAFSEEFLPQVPLKDAFDEVDKRHSANLNILSNEIRYSIAGDEWVEKEYTILQDDRQQHHKYKVHIHDNKFYIVQAVLWDPDTATEKDKQDLEDAWNSFAFCSSPVNCND